MAQARQAAGRGQQRRATKHRRRWAPPAAALAVPAAPRLAPRPNPPPGLPVVSFDAKRGRRRPRGAEGETFWRPAVGLLCPCWSLRRASGLPRLPPAHSPPAARWAWRGRRGRGSGATPDVSPPAAAGAALLLHGGGAGHLRGLRSNWFGLPSPSTSLPTAQQPCLGAPMLAVCPCVCSLSAPRTSASEPHPPSG